jgi:hypothetical protein
MEEHHKRDFQIFLPFWWIIAVKVDLFPAGQSFLNDFSGSFVSNRFLIKSILNRNRIVSKGFHNLSIKNRIGSKPIRFDSPGWDNVTDQGLRKARIKYLILITGKPFTCFQWAPSNGLQQLNREKLFKIVTEWG